MRPWIAPKRVCWVCFQEPVKRGEVRCRDCEALARLVQFGLGLLAWLKGHLPEASLLKRVARGRKVK